MTVHALHDPHPLSVRYDWSAGRRIAMRYATNESANAALAIVINLLDVLTDRGVLEEGERANVLSAAINDLEGNTVSNNDAQRVIAEIWKARYAPPRG